MSDALKRMSGLNISFWTYWVLYTRTCVGTLLCREERVFNEDGRSRWVHARSGCSYGSGPCSSWASKGCDVQDQGQNMAGMGIVDNCLVHGICENSCFMIDLIIDL